MKLYLMFKKLTNSNDKKRLLGNFLSLSGLQVFTYILPLITLPYLVRVLGLEKYGLVMFAQSFIMFFSILVDYGFNLSATREIAINRDDNIKVTEIYSSVMLIKLLLLFAAFLFLFLTVHIFDKFTADKELYYLTFLIVIGQALFPIWYFQGMERMKYITVINILSRIIFTVAIFIFIHDESDYILVPVLNGLGACLGSVYSIYLISKKFNQKVNIPSYSVVKSYFIDSTEFFLSRVSVSIYTSANVFILGLFTTNIMVGYYSIAEKLYQAIQGLYGPINQVLYPYVAKERNVTLYKKILKLMLIINFVGVVFLFFFGEFIFSILFTQEVGVESLKVFHIFLLANLFAVPSVLIGYPFLAALGFTRFTNISVMLASGYHLLGLALIVIFYEITIYSVSILFVTTAIVEFFVRIYGIKRYDLWKLS